MGGGSKYDPVTGTWTAPSYTTNNADGTTTQVDNVGDALSNINVKGTKYFHSNSSLPDSVATGSNAVAIGPNALASGESSIAFGLGARATGASAIAIGSGALATGSQAIGDRAYAGGGGVALGDSSDAGGTPLSVAATVSKGTAIGYGAVVQQTGGVALGAGSTANRAGGTITEAFSGTKVATQAAVSVGSEGAERQITNVAGGTNATDAVNVRQLNQVAARVDEVAKIAYTGTAMAFAMSGTYMPTLYAGEKAVGVGVGSYRGYVALALTFKQLSEDGKMSWGAGMSTTGRDWGVNAGVGWKWK